MTCPTCKRMIKETLAKVEPRSPTLPFCSERCRAADLGSWLNESYRIPGDSDEEELESQSRSDDAEGSPAN
jgi:endogenous inhibitor of DNA gyrase (YacG/DUF329 family)